MGVSTTPTPGMKQSRIERSGAIIQLRDVRKSYPFGDETIEVLRDVDLSVQFGESIAIQGVSGSGKSTLLNLLGAIDRPTSGQVEVCGEALHDIDAVRQSHFRRNHVGFIFQFYNLLPTLSALENVMMGLEATGANAARAREKALEYLDAVDLGNKVHKFPEQMSGGEQQRVSIARALAKEPPLILADEPTGSLDEETAQRVIELLDRLRHEQTLTFLVVTHNPAISEHVDRTLFLHNGRLSER